MSSPPSYQSSGQQKGGGQEHLDEMTCMLYLERQLERTRTRRAATHAGRCCERWKENRGF